MKKYCPSCASVPIYNLAFYSHVKINEIIQDLILEKLTNNSVLIKESFGWTKTGLSEEKSSTDAAAAVIERYGTIHRYWSHKESSPDAAGSGRQLLLFQAAAYDFGSCCYWSRERMCRYISARLFCPICPSRSRCSCKKIMLWSILKGLSHEIDFDNIAKNWRMLAFISAAAGFLIFRRHLWFLVERKHPLSGKC